MSSGRGYPGSLFNPDDIRVRGTIALSEVLEELEQAEKAFPRPFVTAHEGYAVLLEEMDELKAEIWKSPTYRNNALVRKEAIQVAAMALRFLKDCCPQHRP